MIDGLRSHPSEFYRNESLPEAESVGLVKHLPNVDPDHSTQPNSATKPLLTPKGCLAKPVLRTISIIACATLLSANFSLFLVEKALPDALVGRPYSFIIPLVCTTPGLVHPS